MKTPHHLTWGLLTLALLPALGTAAEPLVESLSDKSGQEFDQADLEAAREHHQRGNELARLAQERAQHEGVGAYAAKALISHRLDVRDINTLLGEEDSAENPSSAEDPSSTENPADPRPRAQIGSVPTERAADDDLLARVKSAQGEEFDPAFVDAMTQHETTSLELAKLAHERATRDDVRMFAAQSVQLRQMQLEQLKDILNSPQEGEGAGEETNPSA